MLADRRRKRSTLSALSAGIALGVTLLACGSAFAAVDESLSQASLLDARGPLILGIVLGITAFAVTAALGFLRATRRAKLAEARAGKNAEHLEGELDVLHAILSAEPQTLVYWDENHTPHIAADMLDPALCVPAEADKLLQLESWLAPSDATALAQELTALQQKGTPFNLMLKTVSGAFVEVDGRAKGAGTIMKIRDLAGQREELSKICAEHDRLMREVDVSRTMLDSLRVPAWLRDQDGKLKWVNRAYAEFVDVKTSEDVCGRQIELFSERQRHEAEASCATGKSFRGEMEAHAEGREQVFDVTLLPLEGASAGIAVPQATGIEVNGNQLGSTGAYAKALDQIGTAVAIFSAKHELAYFNQAYRDLWQLEPDWLAGQPKHGEILDKLRADRVLPEQADYRDWKTKQINGEISAPPAEELWHLPDGRTIRVLHDPGREDNRTFLYEDVTERLTLESKYNSLNHVQKETLDNLQEGVVVFASDGKLKLFNRAFARIWKLEPQGLERQPHIDALIEQCRVLLDDDAAWDEVKTAVTSIDHERRSIEGDLSRPDGSQLAYASLPLPDGATLLTYVDITDAKRAERALIERNEALEAAGQLKSTFISHISYELRVPLTNIIGFSELLATPASGPLTDKQQDYLGDIRASSDALLAIINDILDLATMDAGALELRRSKVDLNDIVETSALGVRDRMQSANLMLSIDIDDAPESFEADAQRVRQVLYNLLANAVGFSEEGGIVMLRAVRDGDMVAFTVADTGVGISSGDQEAVFERFERRAQGSVQRGAGLGLSIAKSLVELHGGDIALESAVGEGTSVTVRFPIGRGAKGSGRAQRSRQASGGAAPAAA